MSTWTPEPLALPAADGDWVQFVEKWTDTNLQIVEAVTRVLTSPDRAVQAPAELISLLNDSDRALGNAMSLVGLLSEVHPDEAVRTLSEESTQRAVRVATERGLNRP